MSEEMASKRAGKSAKRIQSLRAKGLSAKQSKGVKGGMMNPMFRGSTIPSSPSSGEILPYIEQDNLLKR